MTEHETRTGYGGLGIMVAFFSGALAGSITALLLAPRSGADTRRMLSETVGRQREKAERMAMAARDAGHAAREAFNERLSGDH